MPFICKCQKIYNDKTFKFELYFNSYVYIYILFIYLFLFLVLHYSYSIYMFLVLIANNLLHCFLSTKIQCLFFHDLGCYLPVWLCYIGSILAFLVD